MRSAKARARARARDDGGGDSDAPLWRRERSAADLAPSLPLTPRATAVYRYDPWRTRFLDADLCAAVPAILGIKDFAADHRADKNRRFCTWAVAAKQKSANAVWAAWRAKADEFAASGSSSAGAAAAPKAIADSPPKKGAK